MPERYAVKIHFKREISYLGSLRNEIRTTLKSSVLFALRFKFLQSDSEINVHNLKFLGTFIGNTQCMIILKLIKRSRLTSSDSKEFFNNIFV